MLRSLTSVLLVLLVLLSASTLVAPLARNLSYQAKGSAAPSSPVTPTLPVINYVLTIIMENHPLNTSSCCGDTNGVIGNRNASYINTLAQNYSLSENYNALWGESLPNYIALIGGDTFTGNPCISGDGIPSASCNIPSPSIVDRIEASGRTWKAYMEDYTGGCFGMSTATTPTGNPSYGYLHNPFPYYLDIQNNATRCNRIVPANPGHVGYPDNQLLSDLTSTSTASNYMWLTPNQCNNMHDLCPGGDIATGSNYLSRLVPQILASPVFKTQSAALFVVWDEPTSCSCPVAAIWAGPLVKQGYVSNIPYSHYSALATVETLWNLRPLTSKDGNATAMTEFFKPNPPSGFSVSNAGSLGVVQRGRAYDTITTRQLSGQTNSASMSIVCAGPLPLGISCSFNPSTYSCPPACSSMLEVRTNSSTPVWTYSINVTVTDGVRTNSTQFLLTVMTPNLLRGDVNGDGCVNVFDLSRVASAFGNAVGPGIDPHTDLNLDGTINIADIVIVASSIGNGCSS